MNTHNTNNLLPPITFSKFPSDHQGSYRPNSNSVRRASRIANSSRDSQLEEKRQAVLMQTKRSYTRMRTNILG